MDLLAQVLKVQHLVSGTYWTDWLRYPGSIIQYQESIGLAQVSRVQHLASGIYWTGRLMCLRSQYQAERYIFIRVSEKLSGFAGSGIQGLASITRSSSGWTRYLGSQYLSSRALYFHQSLRKVTLKNNKKHCILLRMFIRNLKFALEMFISSSFFFGGVGWG